MGFVPDLVLEKSLDEIKTATRLLYCSSQPATYAAAVSAQLGHKDSPTFGSNEDLPAGGRRFSVGAVTDGIGDVTGSCSHWALVRVSDTTLLATEAMASTFDIASGGTVTSTLFYINQPDAT